MMSMTCRRAVLILLSLLQAVGSAATPEGGSSGRPNVLFIVCDDLKPLLGCYGASWIHSPHIDRLAAQGTVFTANYCQVALCAPTRFSLLTGMRPDRTGIYLNPDQPQDLLRTRFPDIVTLPQHFKNHGYVTHPLHKVFDGRTVDEGHDAVSWTIPYGPWELAPGGPPAPGGYQDPGTKARLREARSAGERPVGPATEACDVVDDAYHDGGLARTAAKRIREFTETGRPFFLAVGFVKPHLPFVAPTVHWLRYERESIPLAPFQDLPRGSPYDLAFYGNSGELRDYADVPGGVPLPAAFQRELIHGYAACVTYIDAQVGLLMRTLEECGVAGNTVVCLWGDHGWHLGEHGHWGKLTNYEDAARVPLIVSAPGVGCGRRVGAVTESLDVFPTLCELAGLSAPLHVEGVSLVPLMRGTAEKSRDAALTQACHGRGPQATMGWSVRTPRHRYIEWRSADLSGDRPVFSERPHAVELYDYESDPEERENLATRTEFRTVLAEHQTILARLLPQRPGDGGGTRDADHSGMPVP